MESTLRLTLMTPVHDDRPVFVTGNFCDWQPNLDQFKLTQTGNGHHTFAFPVGLSLPETLEYKYTKGGWDHVELSSAGEATTNRVIGSKPHNEPDIVPHWRWFGQPFNAEYLPKLVGEEFHLPQLDTVRRVTVLLPYNYDANPRPDAAPKRYPVLYMNDGQNLLGEGTGYGSWRVEEKLAILASRRRHDLIIVSIDHGDEQRIQEYTVEKTRQAGRGKGREYLKFIRETLKPVIDANLRTRPDAENTGIGGSSLGGLISLYAGMMHPDVFGRLMVFSPSLWISPKIYFDAIRFQAPVPMRVFVYGGEAESKHMVPNLERFKGSLLKQRYGGSPIDVHISVLPEGTHEEVHWSREFPRAIEWLFYGEHVA